MKLKIEVGRNWQPVCDATTTPHDKWVYRLYVTSGKRVASIEISKREYDAIVNPKSDSPIIHVVVAGAS